MSIFGPIHLQHWYPNYQNLDIYIYIMDVISNVNIRVDPFATLVPKLPKSRIYIYIYPYYGYNKYPLDSGKYESVRNLHYSKHKLLIPRQCRVCPCTTRAVCWIALCLTGSPLLDFITLTCGYTTQMQHKKMIKLCSACLFSAGKAFLDLLDMYVLNFNSSSL